MTETPRLPAWHEVAGLPVPGPGRFYFTTDRFPVFYLQITKCGCTFLRNLFYFIDHDAMHPQSARIHGFPQDFIRADLVPAAEIKSSPYAFAVVRDPAERFLSLYFDKIADLDNEIDKGMRRRVKRAAGLSLSRDMTLDEHRDACLKTLRWIGRNLDTRDEGRPNPHWQRQTVRLQRTEGLDIRLLTLEGLNWQLPTLLSPLIPDIGDRMEAVRGRNRSKKPYSRAEIMTPELEEAVLEVYRQDAEIHQQAKAAWAAHDGRAG